MWKSSANTREEQTNVNAEFILSNRETKKLNIKFLK